jgi:nucleoside phosphorylase
MKLLTFAHRGEAQHFLKYDNYKSLDYEFIELFTNEKDYLLITGEGIESTSERMNSVLQTVRDDISNIINMGITGALDKKLQLESVHSIRKVYLEDEDKFFQSADTKANINCITAKNRVMNEKYSKQLFQIAPIVDRELWTCAHLCNKYQLLWVSLKLISDYAGSGIDSKKIIKKSKQYSLKLYNYYKSNLEL